MNQICDRFNGTCLTTCLKESHGDKCSTGTCIDNIQTLTTVKRGELNF